MFVCARVQVWSFMHESALLLPVSPDSNLTRLSIVVAATLLCLVLGGFVILSLGAAYGEYKSLEDQALKFNVEDDIRILCCLDNFMRSVCCMERLFKFGNFRLLLVAIVCSIVGIMCASSELIFDGLLQNEDTAFVTTNAPLVRVLSDVLYASSRERGATGLFEGNDGTSNCVCGCVYVCVCVCMKWIHVLDFTHIVDCAYHTQALSSRTFWPSAVLPWTKWCWSWRSS
jgi:hypothetical protein